MLNEAGILGFMFICVFFEILTLMGIVAKYCKYPKAATLFSISPYSRDLLVVSMYVACARAVCGHLPGRSCDHIYLDGNVD